MSAGTLPAGLTLDPASGLISGTPTAAGPYSFAVTATDADGRTAASPTFAGSVATAVTITSAPPPNPTVGQAYAYPVRAAGGTGAITYAVTAGTLPAGLTLNPNSGVIGGTPTAAGTSPFTVTATDANGASASQQATLVVSTPLTLAPAALAPTTRGTPFTQTETTGGGRGPATFAVTAGTLPAGLTLDPTTGVLSGTPTTNGPVNFGITATDADGRTATQSYSGVVVDPLAVSTTGIAPASRGVPYSAPIAATGGRGPATFAVSAGALPAGLALNPTTGVVSGTPTANGPFTFAVTATDADGRTAVSPTFAGSVTDPLAVATPTLPTPTKGQPYSQPVTTTGGQGPITFAATGTLPPGRTLDPATGVLSGTPTTDGPFGFTVTATDAGGRAAAVTYSEIVSDPLAVTTTAVAPLTTGQPYSQPIATTGGRGPNVYTLATGALPAGLTLDPNAGRDQRHAGCGGAVHVRGDRHRRRRPSGEHAGVHSGGVRPAGHRHHHAAGPDAGRAVRPRRSPPPAAARADRLRRYRRQPAAGADARPGHGG